ncbi:uncharacterized protein TRIADDRAFT_21399 [Trichoplax adhaerens]|uniref:J domain-containing protein n=1 Tax=Trichoplax adhaerens TaxID=10228 RepID=B3RQ84_TRIAD|nr:hypothetical protein TRIADDRAFT_21399 [Trichoplax adhaerens]EDV27778.1 hypothetical protein TRIADDRAFT_21399 [Trichoplax adhaerens]|eukprot:XP_002109612.1 hypothetical protein TRIADDRAFT_21399 [Trichoplax adhaerens]
MTLLDDCQEHFASRDLYQIIGVDKSASSSEVKRAYYKLSLKVHPDRVDEGERESSTKKFQVLGRIHSVLSNSDARALYDESGEILDEDLPEAQQDRDWSQYWRLLFPKITLKDIQEFETKYRNSAEEKNDLIGYYVQLEGDMETIMENMMCSRIEDENRYYKILNPLIESGELPEFKSFQRDSKKRKKRKKNAEKEAREATKLKQELGINESNDLTSMILKRQENRMRQSENFLASLEAKYANSSKKGKKRK